MRHVLAAAVFVVVAGCTQEPVSAVPDQLRSIEANEYFPETWNKNPRVTYPKKQLFRIGVSTYGFFEVPSLYTLMKGLQAGDITIADLEGRHFYFKNLTGGALASILTERPSLEYK